MKRKPVFTARLLFIAALVLALAFGAAAEDYEAGTMRLLRYEGTVEILDPEGAPRFVLENVRFASGESMRTGEDGMASVGLDDSKIVTLDVLSRVNFVQEDSRLLLKLTEGTMLLDVREKLDVNETLDIETSTMVVGIRGTVVAVSDFPLDEDEQAAGPRSPAALKEGSGDSGPDDAAGENESPGGLTSGRPGESAAGETGDSAEKGPKEILNTDVIGTVHGRVCTLCVLEGTATVTYRSTDGALHTVTVRAGEKAVLTDRLGSGLPDEPPAAERLFREDIEGFVAEQVEKDPVLKERVEKASDALTANNPDYDHPVTLTAASAEKSYDGAGFDGENLDVAAEGLPEGYTFAAAASGTQTEAGSSESTVTEYAIYDSHGLNVTGRFRNLTTRNGTLSVTWDDPVTLIAQSASRMYNGEPLQRTTDVLVNGLPSGYSIRVFADGSQTDAGKSPNPVSTWTIYNSKDEDVTEFFTAVETVDGWLVVDPAPLTVWTGSAEKVYDGTPLTCADAVITSASGYKQGQPRWRNLSYVVSETSPETGASSDCQTLYGICGVVRVHGTNPLTGETREIELHAGEKLLVYLHDADNTQTIEFKLEDVPEDGLPEGILRLFEDNPGLMQQSCADASWKTQTVAGLIEALPERTGEEKMVGQAGLKVAESEAERLMTDFTNVRITIDTEITDYTDRALGHEEAHYTPVYVDETIRVKATGSRTEPGESPNTYSITWGKAKKKNYTLSEKLGTLKVTELDEAAAKIVLTAASDEKTYDGKPLKNGGVVAEGLPEGYTVTAAASGSQTDAGTGVNKVTEYRILNAAGTDVTSGFTNVTLADGTLTVLPAKLTVVTGSAEKVYDGEALTGGGAALEGLVNGETASVTATGSVTEPGETANGYEITWGTAGSGNYTLEEKPGTLKVEKLKLAVDLGGKSVDYSGSAAVPVPAMKYVNGAHAGEAVSSTRLRSMDVLYRFSLFTGDDAEVSISGMEAGAGTHTLVPGVTFPRGAEGRYEVASVTGVTMTVRPAVLTVTTGSAKKAYDGDPLTCAEVSVEGLADGETVTVTATGSVTDAGTAPNTWSIDWGATDSGNYTVADVPGTLEVTPQAVKFDVGGYTCVYSGLPTGPVFSGGDLETGMTPVTGTFENGDPVELSEYSFIYENDVAVAIAGVFSLKKGDKASLRFDGFTDAGTYTMIPKVTFTEGKAANYKFSYVNNELTIGPAPLYFDLNGQTTTFTNLTHLPRGVYATLYDDEEGGEICDRTVSKRIYQEGTRIPLYYFAEFGLIGTDTVQLTCGGPVTAGTYNFRDFIEDITFTSGNPDNYDVRYVYGDVTVNPLNVNLYLVRETEAVYDGQPHGPDPSVGGYYWMTPAETDDGASAWDVTGSIKNETLFRVAISGGGTDADDYPLTYSLSFPNAGEENFIFHVRNETLTIGPAPLTVTTGSAEKAYDGKPLTCGDITVEGLVSGETLTAAATGSRTAVGSSDNTFTLEWTGTAKESNYTVTGDTGTLEVTENGTEIVVTAASLEKTYDGAALTADGFTVDGLPEGFTCEASVSGSRTDAGSGASSVDSWTILDADGIDVSDSFTGVTTQNGTLKILPAPLTVTTGTAKKTYDGTELTCADVTVEGLQNDETISVTTSGTITDAGETDNTCTIVWETANEDNYDVTVKYGKLTVNRARLTITSGSDSKVYDGTALTCGTVTVTGLAAGESITATASGTVTDAGEAKNTISVEWGTVKKANYKVTKKQGTLTVEPLAIQINMDACAEYYAESWEETVYDGLPWTYWFTEEEWDGAYAVYTNGSASGTVLEPDEIQVTYDDEGCGASQTAVYGLPGGGTVRVTLSGVTDAGSYRMIPGISLTAGKAGNYSFSWTDNTLNVSPAPLYFDLNGQTTTFTNLTHLPRGVYATLYDDEEGDLCDRTVSRRIYQEGTRIPLCYFAEFELIGTDTVQLTCGGPVTVGDWNFKDFIEDISFTSGNPANYDIRYTYGDVTVNPLNVNLYLTDETETETVYDGQFHGPDPSIGGYYWMTPAEAEDGTPVWDVTGNIKNETLFRAAISGGGTDAGDYTLTCEFSFPNAGEENFVFHVYNDTLHIEPAPLKITTVSAEKVYDGKPLSGEAVVEGLQGSDTVTVTTASVTGAGETENTYTIEWGETNKDNYTLTQETGTLRVTPRDVEFDLGGRIMAWDGGFHGGDLFVYCEGLGFTVTKESDTVWTVAFDSGDTASVTITGGGINPDCYTLTCSYEFTAGSEDNFNIDCTFDELVISLDPSPSPRPLTIITGSAGKLFDGTPLTNPEVDIEGLRHRDSVTVTATGSQTEIGRSDNTYEIDWGDTDSSSYWLEDELGVLEVIGPDIPITVTTGSAGKAYDGTALTCGEAAVEGLPAGFTWTASACGSRTVAGSSANTLDSFAIFDMDGNDVTEVFTNVTVEEGTLTVTKNDAEIVVTAGSFNKEYSPLNTPTCDKYEITGLPEGFTPEVTIEGSQYTAGTSENVITSFIIRNGDGEDVTENFSSITLVNGTLTITRAKINVRSYGGTRGNTFTECDYTGGSHSWGISWSGVKGSDDPTVWDLEFTDKYGDGWVRDAGTHILSFTPVIVREDLLDKYEIGEVTFGTVTVHPAPLTVTTGSATKAYDGTPLTAGASLNGLLGSDTFQYKPKYIRPTVSATGSVTEAGSAVNGYEIDWGTVNPNNYTLIEDLGTLTVEPAPLTVITDSDTKPYDGTPLTAPGARLEGLAACDDAAVIADGTITDPGSVTNGYVIDWGDTKPGNYRIVEHLGILSVTEAGGAAPLTVITESASKVYDGTPLTAGARLAGLSKDDNATVTATGSLTHAGSEVNTYEIDWGTTDPTKYRIIEDLGTLTVTKAALKVTTGSADKTYDGTPLTAGIVFEGLAGADDATVSAFSGITNAGSAVNTYEIDWGSTEPGDYDITEDLGMLTVTKATLTVKTGSASMVYDGTPLTCDEAEISGLQNGETASVRTTGTITEPGSVDNTYEITWGSANRDNYDIEEELGWLTVYASGGPGHGGELLVSSVYGAKGGAETRTVSEPESENVITVSTEKEDVPAEPQTASEPRSENVITASPEKEDGKEDAVSMEPLYVKSTKNETPARNGTGAGPASEPFTASVEAVLLNKDCIFEGDTVAFRAVVTDGPPSSVVLWQRLNGKEWEDIGTGEKLSLEASGANAGEYRVVLAGADGTVLAEAAFRFPEIQKKEQEKSGTGNEPVSESAAEPEAEENADSGSGAENRDQNESEQPSGQKDEPNTEPAQPSEQKDEPNTEPAQPSGQKDEPNTESAQPSGQKDEPKTEPAQPPGQKDEPNTEPAQPSEPKEKPKQDSAAPAAEEPAGEPEASGDAGTD